MYERTNALVSLPAMVQAIGKLKEQIKDDARTIREERRHANGLEGLAKHDVQMSAREYGSTMARSRLLAYAMLRGRTLEQTEGFSRRAPCPTRIGRCIRDAIDPAIPPDVTLPLCSTTTINRWLGGNIWEWDKRWEEAEAEAA